MQYFSFILSATSEQIEKDSKIKLRDYCYDNTINALNMYMFRTLGNGITFFAYREEDVEDQGSILASFSFDEQRVSFDEAYGHILDELSGTFQVNKVKTDPYDITMYQFLENLLEGKRRDYVMPTRIVDNSKLWIYDYFYVREPHYLKYKHTEKIISKNCANNPMYNQKFKDELANIETHKNASEHQANIVHYVISADSIEAASDMTEALMSKLLRSNRISSRRMEIISEIEPHIYKGDSHLEEMIENNIGGVIVMDLSEKFGSKATEYIRASEYLLQLLKIYRNKCLFVFTYNKNNPGFAFNLLSNISKYVIPVTLSEGTGDRKAAVKYMKQLIKTSEYAEYANQAGEFMKQFPEEEFTQSDVLMAYEQFDSWCLNKNILKAYNSDIAESSSGFMLDRDEILGENESSYEKLNKLIGLDIVKRQIDGIIASDIVEKERKKRKGKGYEASPMHMIFSGNPGTAKTTVAKLFAGIAKEKGILKSGAFVERGGMDLDGFACVYFIRDAFAEAKGGVLFIDEAYSMKSDTAITTLIQEMENKRDEVIVILAGYGERMKEFLELNDGLKSRIPHWVDFPDYTADELTDIFRFMLAERGFSAEEDVFPEAHHLFEKVRILDNFGNGRYVRNMIGKAAENQAVRLIDWLEKEKQDNQNKTAPKSLSEIKKEELFLLKKEDISMLDEGTKIERPFGTARKELDDMIGLTSVKEVIRKAIANYKLNKICSERGISRGNVSLHMVFTGNPGTAKTTVARLFAEIMKDERILSTGNFVEVGRADLVGQFVGHTAPLVKKKFKEAQGGVLFIDEAYALCDRNDNSFGDEAINTLVQEMENHRDDVIVIFAGYPGPMQRFLEKNPGMQSRIAFHVDFEDYTTEELIDITKLMVSNKQMKITDEALDKLRINYEIARVQDDYGNGRYVRKVLEEAEMNLSERLLETTLKTGEENLTTEMVITIEECDIPDMSHQNRTSKFKMGFCAS